MEATMAPKYGQKSKGSLARQQPQQQQNQQKPPPDSCQTPATESEFLVTLKSPIAGGAAVPIGIKLAPAWVAKNNMSSSVEQVDLSWNGNPIATFKLGEMVSALVSRGKDVRLSTRIKIPTNPNKTACGTIGARVKAGENWKELAAVHVEVTHCDCSAVNSGFVLSVQSTKDGEFAVRSIVRRSLPAAVLDRITSNVDGGRGSLVVELKDANFLPDEVFLGFNMFVDGKGLLDMKWDYKGAQRVLTLGASTYLSRTG
jgi:hypothetical protein